MVIAVMVSLSPVNATRADRYFFNQALSYLARQQTTHHFHICTDAPEEVLVKAANVTSHLIPYLNSKNWWGALWQQAKYKQLLKKLEAEVVLCFGASLYIKSPVPHCIMVRSAEIGVKPTARLSKVLERAKSVLTFSESAKTAICRQCRVPSEKVGIVHAAGPDIYRVADENQQASIKERYTNGCEYFLYTGFFSDHSSLLNLLKAFSIFKKRQRTSWKLVLIHREPQSSSPFMEALRTYKYRDEVVVLQENEDLAAFLSAAYAFVDPGAREDYGLYILEAMQSGLAVLMVHNNIIGEAVGDAALYYDGSVADLAEQMMLLYKDEGHRNRQAEKAKGVISGFSWQRTAEEIWEYLN
ncbi:glycosyltransferase [Chitinophagaceae bacterium LB-8]|uniref:Glycosyltransferase n=1 Tax=Paraflavisolibacter caeni TaxID=2982496 RepID=A0A9X3B955_9BACT|nr:glycosyltransferase [Paraflavisolibacter caeni]MCU7551675.1 glycosyltransferase [Paraflavisolibacter caeni]